MQCPNRVMIRPDVLTTEFVYRLFIVCLPFVYRAPVYSDLSSNCVISHVDTRVSISHWPSAVSAYSTNRWSSLKWLHSVILSKVLNKILNEKRSFKISQDYRFRERDSFRFIHRLFTSRLIYRFKSIFKLIAVVWMKSETIGRCLPVRWSSLRAIRARALSGKIRVDLENDLDGLKRNDSELRENEGI